MSESSLLLWYGITFGIVGMTIVYTLIRFLYSKEIIYLSYCIMQLFSLLFIMAYSKLFFWNEVVKEVALVGASLAALTFAIGFYQGRFFPTLKDYKGLIINTILLNIVILTAFYHYMLFEYLPYTIIYAILFISVIFNLKLEAKPILVYVFGWSFFCFMLFIFDFKSYYEAHNFMDIVLVAFAIEAVLFTLSVAYKYSDIQQQSKAYEAMLLQQTKLAKSGEMIGNITHQFRQPLNNIAYIVMNLKKRFENNKLTSEYFDKKSTQLNEQLQFMSKTIDDFKRFYAPSKKQEYFGVHETLENAITIVQADLKKHKIELVLDYQTNESIQLYGIANELSQVIVALLTNAIDALKNTQDARIDVCIATSQAEVIITIQDNGTGIEQKHQSQLFEPYFSTKKEGTGIGLYLSKLIMEESFNGSIDCSSSNEGAKFSLHFEKLTAS